MINSRIELLFKNIPDKYPFHLQRDHIRVLNRLMQIWDLPEFDSCMHELLMGKQSGRQSFPSEVVAELVFLGELHDALKFKEHHLREIPASWKNIPVPNPTPQGFRRAIELGQLDVIEKFLGAGVKADYRFEGAQTPLMVAVVSGQLATVSCLIENGAGVNLRDEKGLTALHWAIFYGRSKIKEALIDADAEICVTQERGEMPFELVVTREYPDAARKLMKFQAANDVDQDVDMPMEENSGERKHDPVEWIDGSHVAVQEEDVGLKKLVGATERGSQDNKPTRLINIPPERIVLISMASILILVILILGNHQSSHKNAAILQSQHLPVAPRSTAQPSPIVAPSKGADTELPKADPTSEHGKGG